MTIKLEETRDTTGTYQGTVIGFPQLEKQTIWASNLDLLEPYAALAATALLTKSPFDCCMHSQLASLDFGIQGWVFFTTNIRGVGKLKASVGWVFMKTIFLAKLRLPKTFHTSTEAG